jgi:hypothetical protein
MSDQNATREPTPAELRELAGTITSLAATVDAMYGRMKATDDDVRHAGFRLAEVAATLHTAADEVAVTAGDLARVRTARDEALCGIPWGVCPEHGNTLTSSGGRSWCRQPGCGRTWAYDRGGSPCTEPVTHVLTDAEGGRLRMCAGHALDAGERIAGGRVEAL